jgi:hypothetical protein
MEAMLEAQGHVSMKLEQAVHLLEGLTNRQNATESQVARIDERTKRLTAAHAREVQLLVERIARVVEKQSATATLQLAHAMVYGRLKTRFAAGSYKEIPDERFEEVMSYLREELRRVTGSTGPEQGSLF